MKIHMKTVCYSLMLFYVCGVLIQCSTKARDSKTAIKINDHVVTVEEFEKGFKNTFMNEDTQENREAYLNMLITRKLVLLEAQKRGLDKEEEFLDAIEAFWEQSLLKIMIDVKAQDLSNTVSVSDSEIQSEFNRWMKANPTNTKTAVEIKATIERKLKRKKEKEAIDIWADEMRKNASVSIDNKAIGVKK